MNTACFSSDILFHWLTASVAINPVGDRSNFNFCSACWWNTTKQLMSLSGPKIPFFDNRHPSSYLLMLEEVAVVCKHYQQIPGSVAGNSLWKGLWAHNFFRLLYKGGWPLKPSPEFPPQGIEVIDVVAQLKCVVSSWGRYLSPHSHILRIWLGNESETLKWKIKERGGGWLSWAKGLPSLPCCLWQLVLRGKLLCSLTTNNVFIFNSLWWIFLPLNFLAAPWILCLLLVSIAPVAEHYTP